MGWSEGKRRCGDARKALAGCSKEAGERAAGRSYPKELDVGVEFGQLGQYGVDLLALLGPPGPEVYCEERTARVER